MSGAVRVSLALSGLLALSTSAGCRPGGSSATSVEQPGAKSAEDEALRRYSRAAHDGITDAAIDVAIRRALAQEPGIDPRAIKLDTTDGIVQLTGEVPSLLVRERAQRLVETVRGVRAVSNELKVRPPKRVADGTLKRDVLHALASDPGTRSSGLAVSVTDGVVTLSGIVDTEAERRLAVRAAAGVRGVEDIDDDMVFRYGAERPDADIAREVTARLAADGLVDGSRFKVSVDGGTVILDGKVGAAAEKTRARDDAWVRGVRSVDASRIEVDALFHENEPDDRARDAHLKRAPPRRSDADVQAAVRQAFAADPRLDPENVVPECKDGIVTLRGTVDSAKERAIAERVALDTAGVVSVTNALSVEPGKKLSPAVIEQRVRAALTLNPDTARFPIAVVSREGTVSLRGSVDNYLQKAAAEDVASGVAGVRAVDNRLDVAGSSTAVVPQAYFYPYYPYVSSDVVGPGTPKPDAEIRKAIGERLATSPLVGSRAVRYAVADGRVTLTGTVNAWSERSAARQLAFEGGAIAVDNRVQVR